MGKKSEQVGAAAEAQMEPTNDLNKFKFSGSGVGVKRTPIQETMLNSKVKVY